MSMESTEGILVMHAYDGADCLYKMAIELGYGENEANYWLTAVNQKDIPRWLNNMWEKDTEKLFGTGKDKITWTSFGYMGMS